MIESVPPSQAPSGWRRNWALLSALALAAILSLAMLATPRAQTGSSSNSAACSDRPVTPPVAPVSSWGRDMNPGGRVPACGFAAFYFDRANLGAGSHRHHVNSIAINYSWDDLHGISSESFAAYWVGLVHFDMPGMQTIAINQGRSSARIFIDGQLVYQGNDAETLSIDISEGTHLVEVEYINNWHTTEFKVTLGGSGSVIAREDVGTFIDRHATSSAPVYYIGLYESDARDTRVDVHLPANARNAVVWLDSYEAIDWVIHSSAPVAAAIIASHSPGSRVAGVEANRVAGIGRGLRVTSEGTRGCHCTAGRFHCEGESGLDDVATELGTLTGRGMAGYAVAYSARQVSITPWTNGMLARIQAREQAVLREANQCRALANPDFDTMFE
ncbi:hypothetical protein [Alteraurantiacibacter aquimixticola]|nr:hypothetical protein [Alteraurantiacibacter aquimixticola]